jgi:tetratricopeptide (TPR) repeat protein
MQNHAFLHLLNNSLYLPVTDLLLHMKNSLPIFLSKTKPEHPVAMIKQIKLIALFVLLFTAPAVYSQSNSEKAREMKENAVKLMDEGQVDESLKILEEAQKLDPENLNIPYEMAFANVLKKNYKQAVKILEKYLDHKNVTDQFYQLLGNSYDYWEKSEKAIEAYDAGLKKFPNSGKLYLEKGNVYLIKKDYNKAIPLYEKGIEVEPNFPSNYYRLALLFCNSKERVWGLLYGELFLNLEHGSKRFYEISELLYATYKEGLKITGDSSSISFCKNMVMNVEDLTSKKEIKLPFCMPFEQTFAVATIGVKTVDINSLNTIRTNFLSMWDQFKHEKNYPNVLFEYEEKVRAAGHLEAYNHYILAGADENSFKEWAGANKEKFTNFINWYRENQITLDAQHKFYRGQY